jgi:hypothetical protein
MTTITIKDGIGLSKTVFENLEEFQTELILMQEETKLSPEHVEILKFREKEADNATNNGNTWEEVKANIHSKNV